MVLLTKLALNTFLAALIGLILYQAHLADGGAIIEMGYRSSSMEHNLRHKRKNQSWLDHWLYWNLCRCAKKSKKTVWIYFAVNLVPCTAIVADAIMWLLLLLSESTGEVLLDEVIRGHGTIFLAFLFVWGGLHFAFDLFFLPSEQKRHHLR